MAIDRVDLARRESCDLWEMKEAKVDVDAAERNPLVPSLFVCGSGPRVVGVLPPALFAFALTLDVAADSDSGVCPISCSVLGG